MDDFSTKIPIKNMDDDELGVARHDETETSMWVKRCHKPVVYTIYVIIYIYMYYLAYGILMDHLTARGFSEKHMAPSSWIVHAM